MKKIGLFFAAAVMLTSCGAGSDQKSELQGEWKLTALSNDTEVIELSDCDKQTPWNFTNETAEALGDGTEVQKLVAIAPDDCKFFGFDASWTIVDGQLFISTSRIGGMGGVSLAGLMQIKSLEPNKMVLTSMKNELTFER